MIQIQNPVKLKQAIKELALSELFSADYTNLFLLRKYIKDEFLVTEGIANDYLFFIWKGTVKCFSNHISGKTQFFTYLTEKEAIGIIGSIHGTEPSCNVQAQTECICVVLPLSHIREQLLNDVLFLRFLCKQLTHAIATNNHYLQITQCSSFESKLAARILASMENGVCHLNLSATAEVIGTTYRTLLRMLSKFCSDGILEKNGKNYRILDESFLVTCAEGSYDFIVNKHYGHFTKK